MISVVFISHSTRHATIQNMTIQAKLWVFEISPTKASRERVSYGNVTRNRLSILEVVFCLKMTFVWTSGAVQVRFLNILN